MTLLETPRIGSEVEWVATHLGDLTCDHARRSARFVGTQAAANHALGSLSIAGYAKRRNEVWPVSSRGASGLSPYIRYGLLGLPVVWDAVADAPSADRQKFRDELMWQEYARHVYARIGHRLATGLRTEPVLRRPESETPPWDRSMKCMDANLTELEDDGWLVNQTRMWMASQWSVRQGARWQDGEDHFFTHLLDGSRAANRLGWQWTIGTGTAKHYGFSQWQVRKRAPSLCQRCDLRTDCPIAQWPDDPAFVDVPDEPLLRHDPDPGATAGPITVSVGPAPDGDAGGSAEVVWLTAESLGDADPALSANPGLPAIFVFDERLLVRLQLSSKRLVFLADRLAEIGWQRDLEVHRGDPATVLAGRRLATTFAPVPKWRRLATELDFAEIHPWPWLRRPGTGPIQSFSAWRKTVGPALGLG